MNFTSERAHTKFEEDFFPHVIQYLCVSTILVVGGTQLATAHLQQTAKNINIIPTGQLNNTSVVSGPAPPPPPPPPTNQQNKSVLRKSQRTCSSATGTANQSLNNSLSAAKESSGNKVITRIEHTNFENYDILCIKSYSKIFLII